MTNRSGPHHDHVGRKLTCLLHCALHRRTVRLTCPACGFVRKIDGVALWWMFERRRWDDRIPAALRRLFCPTCWRDKGRKIRPRATISQEPFEESGLPYPDEREWKRVISRYRS